LIKRNKIAIYSGTVPSTTFIERLLFGLATKGNKILLFGSKNGEFDRLENIKYVTYSNVLSKLFIAIKYTLLLFLFKRKEKKKLDEIIERNKKKSRILKLKYYPVLYHGPDIFHLQWAKSIADWIWVQDFGIKLIVSLRGAHINYSPLADTDTAKTYETLFPKVDGFHAVSKAISIEAVKYNAPMPKIHIVYSGLELDKISFQLKNFDVNTPLNIISVGRAHWKKGYVYALNAVDQLKGMGVNFHYTIVGVGNDEELIYQRAQLDLEKEVSFIATLSFEEVLKAIRSADVLFLSSVEEGIANVVLESMALGTLVISTNCGGMEEVIIDRENGFLVPVRDSEAMAAALKKISEMPLSNYQKITKAARIKIEEQHSHQKMIKGMQALYLKVLNNKPCE
jgi:colanic acid/amylovoran biosynthesis glycosyltransferase